QAEDGIRDFHVTGVQTCALPICTEFRITVKNILTPSWIPVYRTIPRKLPVATIEKRPHSTATGMPIANLLFAISSTSKLNRRRRSEERRVGKECECRRATYR